jgi:hypothetical protein
MWKAVRSGYQPDFYLGVNAFSDFWNGYSDKFTNPTCGFPRTESEFLKRCRKAAC